MPKGRLRCCDDGNESGLLINEGRRSACDKGRWLSSLAVLLQYKVIISLLQSNNQLDKVSNVFSLLDLLLLEQPLNVVKYAMVGVASTLLN